MNDEFDEEKLFALHEKNTVKSMRIVVAVFVAVGGVRGCSGSP